MHNIYTIRAGYDDLFDVMVELTSVTARWKQIGLTLRLDPTKLDVIYTDNKNAEDCLCEVLSLWLKGVYNTKKYGEPSWKMLVEAVRHPIGGKNPALAKEIAKKYGGTCITLICCVLMYYILHIHSCRMKNFIVSTRELHAFGKKVIHV